VKGYGLEGQVSIPVKYTCITLHHHVYNGYGFHIAPQSTDLSSGYRGLLPRGKTIGSWSRPLTSILCRC